jgi:hypothetical protein
MPLLTTTTEPTDVAALVKAKAGGNKEFELSGFLGLEIIAFHKRML